MLGWLLWETKELAKVLNGSSRSWKELRVLHKPMRSEKSFLRYQSTFLVDSSPRTRWKRKAKSCLFQRSLRASNPRIDEVFDLGSNYLTVCALVALLLPEEPVKWSPWWRCAGLWAETWCETHLSCPQCLHYDGMNKVSLCLWYRKLKGTGLNMDSCTGEVWAVTCFSKHR